MGSGRTLTITVVSARGLADKDDGSDFSDPYVLVCFDGLTQNALGRTTTIANNLSPNWDETFTVDLTAAMRSHMDLGLAKPANLTFVVRDADEGYDEPLGMASIPLKTLLTAGEVEGQYDINDGEGKLHVKAKVQHAKVSSMGYAGAAGVGAVVGGIVGYLTGRNRRRRRRERMEYSDSDNSYYGGHWNGGGVGYGYYNSDTSDEDNQLNNWWEMDDISSDEDKENVWFNTNGSWHSSSSDNDSSDNGNEDDNFDDGDD